MWDSSTARYDKRDELGSRFEGSVRFQDSRRNRFENRAILDWATHFDTLYVGDSPDVNAKTVADKLTEIAGVLKGYTSEHGGVWVYPKAADEERQYLAERAAQLQAHRDRINEMLNAGEQRYGTPQAGSDETAPQRQ
ncbi:hypothetical protein MPRM_12560 [Mycobacterium parmense]|uniref:Uncharacterized protein n=2 Tax=Mycobacterium parmense TaxID=185642 RepID=A0A7I7YQ22_9MYCO|nr:hypothetical protein MPRM_12560 [Mycobacterium parmense]